MANRQEFSDKTKLAAWARCKGHCERCGCKIVPGNGPEYHHQIPAGVDGPGTLDNCEVLCIKPCHSTQTAKVDKPALSKTRRILEKRIGLRKTKQPMMGSRASGWKIKMDGTRERR